MSLGANLSRDNLTATHREVVKSKPDKFRALLLAVVICFSVYDYYFCPMNHRNKLFTSYYGSKNVNGTYQTIINHLPPHKIYIEGFIGSGIIMQQKKPASLNIGIDKDAAVIYKLQNEFRNPSHLFMNCNFLDIFPLLTWSYSHKDTLMYLDPPYMMHTRTHKKKYKHEFGNDEHKLLMSHIQNATCSIALSCYDNEYYSNNLKHWNKINFNSITRSGVRVETLYMNYEINSLHDYKFLGKDFTDRQRIKRRINLLVSKLKSLPTLERAAVIDALVNAL